MSYYIIYVSFQKILNNLVWKPGCGDGLPIACHVSETCGVNSHKPVELSDVFNSSALQRWHWLNKKPHAWNPGLWWFVRVISQHTKSWQKSCLGIRGTRRSQARYPTRTSAILETCKRVTATGLEFALCFFLPLGLNGFKLTLQNFRSSLPLQRGVCAVKFMHILGPMGSTRLRKARKTLDVWKQVVHVRQDIRNVPQLVAAVAVNWWRIPIGLSDDPHSTTCIN